ncbi:MAG: hypothetical protein JEZ06_05285 [Anaerolineaceae bacterium]|nr:hypothetical protein [Anaerolineaceae bacterium]
MTKLLVATEKPFAKAAVVGIREIAEDAGFEFVLLEKYADKSDLLGAVLDADALIIRSDKVTREVIEAGKKLKIVVRAGAGYDNVDLDAATDHDVVVMNTPGQNANAVAELVLGMMVYVSRNQFNGKPGRELKGKKLGLHAFGNVGKQVAHLAKAFGMEVYAYDPFLSADAFVENGINQVDSVEQLYAACNFISLHIPATKDTIKSVNYDLLSSMQENAVLINTARKEVIDEDDLLKVLKERGDFVFASDIAPDCKDQITADFEGRYYFTPKKMGAQTVEANVNAGLAAANQIRKFIEDGDKTFQVNK